MGYLRNRPVPVEALLPMQKAECKYRGRKKSMVVNSHGGKFLWTSQHKSRIFMVQWLQEAQCNLVNLTTSSSKPSLYYTMPTADQPESMLLVMVATVCMVRYVGMSRQARMIKSWQKWWQEHNHYITKLTRPFSCALKNMGRPRGMRLYYTHTVPHFSGDNTYIHT